jgi:hypothetical protein
MNVDHILVSIDEQISKLQQARAMLAGSAAATQKPTRGRPKKIVVATLSKASDKPKKRVMSTEAKARIAAAQKKRWAAARKATK